MGQATASDPTELVLGRYRPLTPLGSGGSGSVWLARDERSAREVALKIVSREGKAGSRAEREVEAGARLRHPRCLRALDFASDDDHVYIAYEHVPGKTLRQALRDGEIDDRKAIEACAQILEALEHAHSQGIVHRDVKPANVLLVDGPKIDVRLVDFGLASFAEAETLTELGDIPGTLAYVSPERLAGQTASEAADVWAAGVVLWESLVGWHPFWAGSAPETARRIECGASSLKALRPDLPVSLVTAVERSLSLDPQERPGAGELARALRLSLIRAHAPKRSASKARGVKLRRPDYARFGHALASALIVAWGMSEFPFYPAHSQIPLTILAAAVSLARPRGGSILTLSLLLLPFGNYSFGLAVVFAVAAGAWLAYTARSPELSQLPVIGPLAAAAGGLFLLPLAVLRVRSAGKRAVFVSASYLLALIVAGTSGKALPPTGAVYTPDLGIEGSASPSAVFGSLAGVLTGQPALLATVLLLASASALIPRARRHSRWGGAILAGSMIALALLPFSDVRAVPVVVGTWLTALFLAIPSARTRAPRSSLTRRVAPSGGEPGRVAI